MLVQCSLADRTVLDAVERCAVVDGVDSFSS